MTTAKRRKLLAVLLNSLWRVRQDGPFNKVIEMHISEQTAHLAAGICWVLPSNEFKSLGAEIEKIIPTQGKDFKANQGPNILAAMAYHSQFLGEEMVPGDLITSSKANYWTLTRQVIMMG
ncbi:hypothetical protein SI65_06866 [Aspergillus cristatus]|uniref:Uncharacterized protein n=1 Tax=Aspergillus cristatus TaxID=573508 RepID=A0A1E3BB29_ASPCR|nr:hypothetical protein SI65_06866 [Aspergillus cristatus]